MLHVLLQRQNGRGVPAIIALWFGFILLGFLGSPVHSQNLVTNGGFKLGSTAGWRGAVPTSAVVVTDVFRDDIADGSWILLQGDIYQDLATIPGDYYELSFWAQTSEPSQAFLPNTIEAYWGNTLASHVVFEAFKPPWVHLVSVQRAESVSTRLRFSGKNSPYLDGVVVTPVGSEYRLGKMTAPNDGAVFREGDSIEFRSEWSGAPTQTSSNSVVYFVNGATRLGASASPNYPFLWTNVSPGIYYLSVGIEKYQTTPVKVTVEARPKLQIFQPARESVFAPGIPIHWGVRLPDNHGPDAAAQVRFLVNDTLVQIQDVVGEYLGTKWTPPGTGDYDFSVVGVRSDGSETLRTHTIVHVLPTPTLDQTLGTGNSYAYLPPGFRAAQTFTAGVNGRLHSVELVSQELSDALDARMLLEVRDTVDGHPGTNLLGATSLTLAEAYGSEPAHSLARFSFPSNRVLLRAGNQYSLVFEFVPPTTGLTLIQTQTGDIYRSGRIWYEKNGAWKLGPIPDPRGPASDFIFNTLVSPIAPPTVQLTQPEPLSRYASGSPILISAVAHETDSSVRRVVFLANGQILGTKEIPPFDLQWTGAPDGNHTIKARVEGIDGGESESEVVSIQVGTPDSPLPRLRVEDTYSPEGNRSIPPLVFRLSLSASSPTPVSVNYETRDLTAIAPLDYLAATGTVTFPPGQTQAVVFVRMLGDLRDEAHKRMRLELMAPQGAILERPAAVGTILDDELGLQKAAGYAWDLGTNQISDGQDFSVTLTARDPQGDPVLDVAGTVRLEAVVDEPAAYTLLDNASPTVSYGFSPTTEGYSFRPATDLLVTHLRCQGGVKVSLWDEQRHLLAMAEFPYDGSAWQERELASPVRLRANVRYRIGAYSGNFKTLSREDRLQFFAHGSIERALFVGSDAYPDTTNGSGYRLVDFRYHLAGRIVGSLSPRELPELSHGSWSGAVRLTGADGDLRLLSTDSLGRIGLSDKFHIEAGNAPVFSSKAGVPDFQAAEVSGNSGERVATPLAWGGRGLISLPENWTNLVQLVAANNFMIGRTDDRKVVACWVEDQFAHALATPEAATNLVSVAAGYYFGYGLRADGSLIGWGAAGHVFQEEIIHPPDWLTNAIAISAGFDHTIATTSDGYLVGWGADERDVLNPPYEFRDPVQIYSGQGSSIVRLREGGFRGWGMNAFGELNFPHGLDGTETLALSSYGHVVALKTDGTVVAWGSNGQKQANVPPGLSNVVQVAVGSVHSLALRQDGSVVLWGANGAGVIQTLTNSPRLFSVAAGETFNCGLTLGPVPAGGPRTETGTAGSDLVLTADFRSRTPFRTHWRFNGRDLEDSAASELSLTNLQSRHAGQYTRVADNEFGVVESAPIAVVIQPAAPQFLVQPNSVAVFPGDGTSLQAGVRGSEPLSYQWSLNGSEIPGATNAILTIPSARPSNAGAYQVTARNDFGSTRSSLATVSTGLPQFLLQIQSQTLLRGMTAELQAAVLAPEPPVFRWWLDGQLLEGDTSPSLIRSNFVAKMAGSYWFVASNSFGAVTSVIARLDFQPWPVPTLDPGLVVESQDSGFTRSFQARYLTNAVAIAAGGLVSAAKLADESLVTWSPSGQLLADRQKPPASATNIVELAAGYDHCVGLRADGTVVVWGGQDGVDDRHVFWPALSQKVVHVTAGYGYTLGLLEDGSLFEWPGPGHAPAGLDRVVNVATFGSVNLAQRSDNSVWYWSQQDPFSLLVVSNLSPRQLEFSSFGALVLQSNGHVTKIDRNGGGDLPLPEATQTDRVSQLAYSGRSIWLRTESGHGWTLDYFDTQWKPVPYNLFGITRFSASPGFLLATTRAPFVTVEPNAKTVLKNTPAELSVEALSFATVRYQWRRDGLDLPGQTNQTLDIASAGYADEGHYSVRIANEVASVETQPVPLVVLGSPDVVLPLGQSVPAGTNLTLTPLVSGTPPLRFQWFHDSLPIPGETAGQLRLPNVQSSDAGGYTIRVANSFGTATNTGFQLQVIPSVARFLEISGSQKVREGDTVRLSAVVQGSEPLHYQWQQNGKDLPGETNAVLVRSRVRLAFAGTYVLKASNLVDTVGSPAIDVQVEPVSALLGQFPRWQVVNEGDSVTLAPDYEASKPVALQWFYFDQLLPGETNSTLRWSAIEAGQAGDYFLRLSNEFGSVIAGTMHLAVRRDSGLGALVAWGNTTVPADLDLVTALSAGREHTLVVDQSGRVRAWGRNDRGQASPPNSLGSAHGVSAGIGFSVALLKNGSVAAWGDNRQAQTTVPTNLGPVVAVAAGSAHTLALRRDGTVTGWGGATGRVLDLPAGLSNVVSIAANGFASLALREDGQLVGWGTEVPNLNVGSYTNVKSMTMGLRFALAIDQTGQAIGWGGIGQQPAPGITNFVQVSGGAAHALGLRSDGTVIGWGSNLSGQLRIPQGLGEVIAVGAGGDYSLAVTRIPVVVDPPAAAVLAAGTGLRLIVHAVGLGPLTFQWFKNGLMLPNETNAVLHWSQVAVVDGGTFGARIANPFGSVLSTGAQITVVEPFRFGSTVLHGNGLDTRIENAGLPSGSLWESPDLVHWSKSLPLPPSSNSLNLRLLFDRDRTGYFYRYQVP